MQECRRHSRKVRQIRTYIGMGLGAERKEIAVFIQRQFDLGQVVAAMRVGQERLAAIRRPFDRTAQFLGRSQDKCFFSVVINF